jgi:hypothetical protein
MTLSATTLPSSLALTERTVGSPVTEPLYADFTVPEPGASTMIMVEDRDYYPIGAWVTIQGAGWFQISASYSNNVVVVTNFGSESNEVPGTVAEKGNRMVVIAPPCQIIQVPTKAYAAKLAVDLLTTAEADLDPIVVPASFMGVWYGVLEMRYTLELTAPDPLSGLDDQVTVTFTNPADLVYDGLAGATTHTVQLHAKNESGQTATGDVHVILQKSVSNVQL